MPSYLTEEDGSTDFLLEEGGGDLLLEDDPADFVSNGSLGHTSNKTSGQTLSLSPSRLVPGNAGRVIVVWAAWEGDRSYTDALGYQDLMLACTDSAGNLYTQLQSALYDASEAMFVTYVDNDLTTGDTITLTHRSSILEAKAMSVEEFQIDPAKRFLVIRDGIGAREDPQSGDARGGDILVGLLYGSECLVVHAVGTLRPVTDAWTWDSDYTQIVPDGTTGGSDSSNITLRGGYRIYTPSVFDTISVSNATADTTDMWQGVIGLVVVDLDANFPTFPNFDNFNRADEDPLAQPPWDQSTTHGPGFQTARLRVDSNKCARSHATGAGSGAMFWLDPIPGGDDGEVFVTIDTLGSSSATWIALCFASGSGQDATLDSYGVASVGMSDGRPDRWDFGEVGNAGGRIATSVIVWGDRSAGDKMGLQMRESGVKIHLWLDLGLGWRWVSGWHKLSSVNNGGYFGLDVSGDDVVRLDDFGGGTSSPFLPQIIRRLVTTP